MLPPVELLPLLLMICWTADLSVALSTSVKLVPLVMSTLLVSVNV